MATPRRPVPPFRLRGLLRSLLVAAGFVSIGLGVAGIFLPVLPTTPFLLLSAWCFARSSPRLYRKLLQNRHLGLYVRRFRGGQRALPLRVKVVSCLMVWISLLGCTAFAPVPVWVRPVFPVLAVLISRHILSFATLRRP